MQKYLGMLIEERYACTLVCLYIAVFSHVFFMQSVLIGVSDRHFLIVLVKLKEIFGNR
jgi:hypothetical protein